MKTRGANSTSVDAFIVAETPAGRRAYLMEWKYVEEYRTEDKGRGRSGETRRARYVHLYAESPSFNGRVPFDAWLFEPFYQILRLRLLADRMVRNCEFGGFGGEGRCRRSRGKPSLSGAGDVAMARQGVPEQNGLGHRPRDACPLRPCIRDGLPVGLGRLGKGEMRHHRGTVGRFPIRAIWMVAHVQPSFGYGSRVSAARRQQAERPHADISRVPSTETQPHPHPATSLFTRRRYTPSPRELLELPPPPPPPHTTAPESQCAVVSA